MVNAGLHIMELIIKNMTTAESRRINISEQGRYSIGRSENSYLRLDEKTVSRHHADLIFANDSFFAEDSASRSGTFINGTRIETQTPFNESDSLRIGNYEITIVSVPPPGSTKDDATCIVPQQATTAKRLPLYESPAIFPGCYTDDVMELSRQVHSRVLELLNLSEAAQKEMSTSEMRPRVVEALDRTLREIRHRIPEEIPLDRIRQTLMDDLTGYGPLSPLLRDNMITEIMINGPGNIFIESRGLQYRTAAKFHNEIHLQSIIQRIVEPIGRHIDAASPMVDARLPDGSRVNAVIPPLALDGSLVTIRKFAEKKLTDDDLINFESLTRPMALFLRECVRARRNILVSGGTGSGKTTLLNVLSQFIPENERIITVEDSAELKLSHENICRLEARPANVEGQGKITIRDLVVNTLRMRPDRIVVGECRGAEALDMLQAMNTGHDGSMTTCHANNPRDALSRLENMVMMAGFELPSSAIREQIASAINIIVQQTRMPDGSRKIVKISEVTGREGDVILTQDIFMFEQEGFDEKFRVTGRHSATGNIPRFIDELRQAGDLQLSMSVFVPEA